MIKKAANYNRDIAKAEYEKSKKDTIVFDLETSITKTFDFLLPLRGEAKNVCKKTVEDCLRMHAQSDTGFDSLKLFKKLTCERKICSVINSGKSITTMKNFNGDVSNVKSKSVPRYVYFRRELTHVKYSF